MTDFFTQLEGELRRAHARGAGPRLHIGLPRRPVVLRLAVTAAAGAALVAAVILLVGGSEPERDVTVPAAPGACASVDPPAEVARALGVLREAPEGDPPPREVEEAAARGVAGAARLWPSRMRFARDDGERSYWVVPAVIGSCESPEPGACVLAAAPYRDVPACAGLERIAGEGMPLFAVPLDGGRWRGSALVTDGVEPAIVVGGRRVTGTVEGNVFVAEYEASHAEQERSRLTVGGRSLHSPDTDPDAAG